MRRTGRAIIRPADSQERPADRARPVGRDRHKIDSGRSGNGDTVLVSNQIGSDSHNPLKTLQPDQIAIH